MTAAQDYRQLGEAAWSWVLAQVRDRDGPWLPEEVPDELPAGGPAPGPERDSLYAGIAGLAPVLAELALQRAPTGAERLLADRIVARLCATVADHTEPSLYLGLAGNVTALRLLAPGREQPALHRLSMLATPDGWPGAEEDGADGGAPATDMIYGSAGVILTAAWAGGPHAEAIMTIGGEALLRIAEPAEAGLDWPMRPGMTSRYPNYSHGTAGVAAALAVAGRALDRNDFVAAARLGAEHLLAIGSLDGGGFVIPHTVPPSTRDAEPVTYGWCHGPTGTSHLFAALAHAGVPEVAGHPVTELRRRCLNAVLTSGLPRRLRPGFWDNDGRCCGTAGVGDALLDAAQDDPDPARFETLLQAARVMGDALIERSVRTGGQACWRFVEHRRDPSLLPPGTSWMQGAAGIAAFLLRLARVIERGPDAPIVDRPDQCWAVPARLRTSSAGG